MPAISITVSMFMLPLPLPCDIIKVEKYGDTVYTVSGQLIPPPNPVQKCLVFRSLDGGNTWEENENTLAQFPANRMCIYNGNIFISVQSKIFRADLDVDNWVDLQWAYEEPVHEMGFSVSGLFVFNDKMYAATDKGLYATVLDNPTGRY